MNIGHIAGGTRAGWRKVKQKHPFWTCHCPHLPDGFVKVHPGYLSKCKCGNPRPN